ncbi:MAG TPA: AI-2E family transporter [Stellaceae bacterium]|nr:AI-2E family transporter [Stellaceae bacterium]
MPELVHRMRVAPASGPSAPRAPRDFGPALNLLVFLAVVAALYLAREVLIPLALALLLSILLAPLVGVLKKLRLGRVSSVLFAVLFALGVIGATGGLIGSQIASLADNLPAYAQTLQDKAAAVRGYALDEVDHLLSRFQHAPAPQKPAKPAPVAPAAARDAPKPAAVEIRQPDPTPFELAERYLSPLLSPLGTAAIVFVVSIFLLLQQDDLRDRLIRLLGSNDLRRTTVALDEGGRRLSRYFLAQLGVNALFGLVIGLGLFLIGVPIALLWGVLAGLLRFVPYIGSFISVMFPLALSAAVDPGWSMLLWTCGLFLGVELIVTHLVEPPLYGASTGLSPLAVVVAAIFWSWLWGPVGLIVSTPLTLCLVVLGRHVDRLEFLAVMLGDRPALTPVEGFYQRILAGDQDETRDHAEQLLKERSLTAYYDEIALHGLELAAIDAKRGILSEDQLGRIRDAFGEVIEDLEGHLEGPPDEGVTAPPAGHVLCVAGRGPLDEVAAAMLCQLLRSHGVTGQVVPYEAVTRGNIGLLDTGGAALACISYLDVTNKLSHLRYLIGRLRQRMPEAPLIVGLWPGDAPPLPDFDLRNELGADYYIHTLREAVEICLREARAPGALPVPAVAPVRQAAS